MNYSNLIVAGLGISMASIAAAVPGVTAADNPTTIRIISSMATRQVLAELIEQFEKQSGYRVEIESVGGVDAVKRVEAGEAFDVVILASNAIDKLIDSGKIVAGSRVDLVKSGIAIAVPEGAVAIDISNEQAVKQAVLAAKTLSYSTGPSGVYLTGLFERWGIADHINHRIVKAPPGVPVGSLIAKGEVELGFQQLSELLHLKGIVILGPLPADIQMMTVFSSGVTTNTAQKKAVATLLNFLASPQAAEVKVNQGMEPI